ncbi:hypothetical protein BASA50_009014 [Batrachochytrium salamandrivorans]|uniref:Rap-GAP domain-containing protein n=1 Tax=Batrachochytrium salamandrivorans TaxID=1357716 RepID=A0ABQ8F5H3_9FUNG|nr:hypothetical protein BASA61_000206 [Batrachochytrium salamandrivorans]KAH6591013.1 hypothetical protein BASA50_009014 [Batrachochytrium salamandrivorans]
MPDERRLERLLKKAKPFLDEKQKAKSRLKSLVTFLEGTTEPDHIRFFQDHGRTIYNLVLECLAYRVSRICEKVERTYSSTNKDTIDLLEILSVLGKYINCVDSKALLEWTAPSIIGVFELFLATGCHQRFRVEGLRLLLQYISASGTYQSDEYTQLYSDAIQLDLFEPACPSLSDWQQNNPSEEEIPSFSQSSLSSRWIGKGRGSLLQNPIRVIKRGSTEGDATQAVFPLSIPKDTILYPVPWATQTDQCELIDEILQNLMNLATALAFSIPQLEYSPTSLSDALAGIIGQRMSSMWLIFRKTYLRLLFPSVSRYVGIEIQDNQGFEHCPPQILQKLVRFIVRTVSPNISVSTVMSPPEFAAAAITDVILAENGSIDTVQEIIKQALRLPTSFYKTTQSALFVIVSWLSSSPEQNSPGLESNSALQKEEEEIDMCDTITLRERQINRKLRKYIKNIQLVFTPKPVFPEQHENQIAVYQDAFDIYRAMASDSFVPLEPEIWKLMMTTLLEIQSDLFQDPVLMKSSPALIHTVAETVLTVWIRSRSTDEQLWKKLRVEVTKLLSWKDYVKAWAGIMIKLTHTMAEKVYDFDVSLGASRAVPSEKENSRFRSGRKTIGKGKNLKDLAAAIGDGAKISSHISDQPSTPLTNQSTGVWEFSTLKDSRFLEKLSIPPPSPNIDKGRKEGCASQDSRDSTLLVSKETRPYILHAYLREKAIQYAVSSNLNLFELVVDEDSISRCIVANHKIHYISECFVSIKSIDWLNSNNSLWIWKSILCTIGRVSEIKTPEIHYEAILCISQVWDLLEKIRESQKFDNVHMPSLFDFAATLFDVTYLPIEFVNSIVVAVGCISRIMCRRHDQVFSEEYYIHYYRILDKWLSGTSSAVISSILLNTQRIFTLSLPGSCILIPRFLKSIHFMTSQKDIPDAVSTASIQILSSLVCMKSSTVSPADELPTISPRKMYPADTPSMAKPRIYEESSSNPITDLSFLNPSTIKSDLFDLVVKMLRSYSPGKDETKVPFIEQITWTLGVMAFEECLISTGRRDMLAVHNCIGVLLDNLSLSVPRLARSVIDCFTLFAHNYDILKLEMDLVHQIIDRIVIGISENLQFDEKTRKQTQKVNESAVIVSMLFRCLVDWLSCAPKSVMTNPNIALRVSEVIEEAVHVSSIGIDAQYASGTFRVNSTENISAPEVREQTSSKKETLLSFKTIRACAENAMMHLLHHVDNFAPTNGPAMMNSHISEPSYDQDENHNIQIFAYNDNALLSFIDLQKGSHCRIIMRDCTGKYVWDVRPFYKSIGEVEPVDSFDLPASVPAQKPYGSAAQFKFNDNVSFLMEDACMDLDSSDSESQSLLSTTTNVRTSDALEQLLIRIGKQHVDCLLETQPDKLNTPSKKLVDRRAELVEVSLALENQVTEESGQLCKSVLAHNGAVLPCCQTFIKASPIAPKTNDSVVPISRLLLSQMGFLTFDFMKSGDLHLLSKTPSLTRDIKGLDRKYSRDVAKVAVIYIAPGQEDEYAIFHNSGGSAAYNSFVSSLGWEVDLEKHSGYLGGLERNMVSGGVATYFCTSTLEIMFHDITKMPTDPADPKQLKKKRHIGNDHVHVIWNEHYRDYKWKTIGGDFGNAQIAITPLSNGMYSVDIYRDESVRPFGLLQSRMVVSKMALGPLVRSTADSAYRAALLPGNDKSAVDQHPFSWA